MEKGFTLTELLGVIVIVGILLLLIVPTIINRIGNTEDEAKESNNQIIYNAADQYIKEHPEDYPPGKSGRYCITIKSLIDDGKLAEPVIDITTGKDISDKSVMVTIYSTGNMEYEIKEGDECEDVVSSPFIDFIVEPSGSDWVKQRTVIIIYPKVEGYKAEHKVDNGNWVRDANQDNGGYSDSIVFNKIGTLEARLKGNQIISSKINLINIDSEKPVVKKVTKGTWNQNKRRVEIIVRDDISGVDGIYIGTTSITPNENDSKWVDITSEAKEDKTYKSSLGIGTYYIWVKDKAGNISTSSQVIEIEDTKAPSCTIKDSGTMGEENWYKGDVTLSLITQDGESGVATYGLSTSDNEVYNDIQKLTLTNDTKGQTYYGYVKDEAGNVGTCSKTVKRDTVKPECSLKLSGTEGKNEWYISSVNVTFDERNDETSGVTEYGLTTSSSVSYNSQISAIQTNDTKSQIYYGYVKDEAGHTNKCEITVKKDTVKPEINCKLTLSNGSNYITGTWSRSSLKQSISSSDTTSKVNRIETNSSGSWKTAITNSSYTKTLNEGKHNYSFRAVDNAGNVSNTCSINGLVDWTPPSTPYCKFSLGTDVTLQTTNCNGSRNCSSTFKVNASAGSSWSTSWTKVQKDNVSGIKDLQQYWVPSKYTSNSVTEKCIWLSNSDCGGRWYLGYNNLPVTFDNRYRTIDYAGNVSNEALCEIVFKQ